ncbi:diguanylate cyclase [Scandinavium sp. V105_16]|uniref:diguanylate cyclase n=1 Tax=Scandinavium lactucae TaxID=3095028 RepID=A0AAJ2SA02_9ENTR|nr:MULTISPECIES: diguanylate cyclase [unclassified Scandinavium]MDX6019694.1 diguanylate cyclase [Scandinavium sp. V105_16]MDX6032774.1 diguanylate cyclase [Scandinavium sp. V105_12]MDX6040090.1 diguanylate cyclase [Scandinavium sp. V105_6]MDX6048643.1 diguanylate cyclase [Scandinavium sp. V105_1]
MKIHSRQLSFTRPILVSFAGLLVGFILIAVLVTLSQRKDIVEDYHEINRNFTHNLAVNYTASILQENDHVLDRAARFYSHNDALHNAVSIDRVHGLERLMQLLVLMPRVSSISIADEAGHYLRAPQAIIEANKDHFDAKTRPWFAHQADSAIFSRYTDAYVDFFTHQETITLFRPVVAPDGLLKGTLAFHLDLSSMSYTLRQMQSPVQGEYFVVNRLGRAVLHPHTSEILKTLIAPSLMNKMTNGEGAVYDKKNDVWIYYYSFTNPDWFVIFKVSGTTLSDLARHETITVAWGFALVAILIVLFGLYLRHASRTVLMNIINAINTGDIKQAPKLEATLSKAILSNKERELTYVRQATVDALTGCKNRRAFDSEVAALINDNQPFALSMVDIDNFKSINDTWGHLSGDIVLRNVAREGIQVLKPHGVSLYRYGGEEFAVVFTEDSLPGAIDLLEEWREKVAQRSWREEGLRVTFSGGFSEWSMEPLDQLISTVDEALYKAKQQGKNQILRSKPV